MRRAARTWKGAAGWADSYAKRRADPDDRFAIESTTKTFVATVVLQLAGERRLALDDTVQHWLPGLFPARPRITIRQLLNHSSGIPSDFGISEPRLIPVEPIAAQGMSSVPARHLERVLQLRLRATRADRREGRSSRAGFIRRLHLRSTAPRTQNVRRPGWDW